MVTWSNCNYTLSHGFDNASTFMAKDCRLGHRPFTVNNVAIRAADTRCP
jgi:hypothetical protein